MIRGARERGVDVTTESYPYTAGSTRIESARLDHWEEESGGRYDLLQWLETGERLTKETFEQYRKQGGWVILHGRSEEASEWLLAQPDVMVASDGTPFVGGLSHPRSAGTFSRVLGHYARERQTLPLMQALAKMTILPARRLVGGSSGDEAQGQDRSRRRRRPHRVRRRDHRRSRHLRVAGADLGGRRFRPRRRRVRGARRQGGRRRRSRASRYWANVTRSAEGDPRSEW